jgi:hypothetical protein
MDEVDNLAHGSSAHTPVRPDSQRHEYPEGSHSFSVVFLLRGFGTQSQEASYDFSCVMLSWITSAVVADDQGHGLGMWEKKGTTVLVLRPILSYRGKRRTRSLRVREDPSRVPIWSYRFQSPP